MNQWEAFDREFPYRIGRHSDIDSGAISLADSEVDAEPQSTKIFKIDQGFIGCYYNTLSRHIHRPFFIRPEFIYADTNEIAIPNFHSTLLDEVKNKYGHYFVTRNDGVSFKVPMIKILMVLITAYYIFDYNEKILYMHGDDPKDIIFLKSGATPLLDNPILVSPYGLELNEDDTNYKQLAKLINKLIPQNLRFSDLVTSFLGWLNSNEEYTRTSMMKNYLTNHPSLWVNGSAENFIINAHFYIENESFDWSVINDAIYNITHDSHPEVNQCTNWQTTVRNDPEIRAFYDESIWYTTYHPDCISLLKFQRNVYAHYNEKRKSPAQLNVNPVFRSNVELERKLKALFPTFNQFAYKLLIELGYSCDG